MQENIWEGARLTGWIDACGPTALLEPSYSTGSSTKCSDTIHDRQPKENAAMGAYWVRVWLSPTFCKDLLAMWLLRPVALVVWNGRGW